MLPENVLGKITLKLIEVSINRSVTIGMRDINDVAISRRTNRYTGNVTALGSEHWKADNIVGADVKPGVEVSASQFPHRTSQRPG